MKKLFSLAIAMFMLFALVACNNDDMQSKIDQMQARLQTQTDKIAELEQSKTQQDGQIAELEQLLQSMRQENETIKQELETKQNLLNELRDVLIVDKVDVDHDINKREEGATYSQPTSSNACGYRFYNVVHKRSNVKVTFAYGNYFYNEYDYESSNSSPNYADIRIRSAGITQEGKVQENDNEQTISIIDNYYSYPRKSYYVSTIDDFTYIEQITIPEELFVDEIGWISIFPNIYYWSSNSEGEGFFMESVAFGIRFYYQAIGDFIILSPEITVNGYTFD